jgi:hypothetical protein
MANSKPRRGDITIETIFIISDCNPGGVTLNSSLLLRHEVKLKIEKLESGLTVDETQVAIFFGFVWFFLN